MGERDSRSDDRDDTALDVPTPAAALQNRIATFIASLVNPELSAVHVVRDSSDVSPAMRQFVVAHLDAQFDATQRT